MIIKLGAYEVELDEEDISKVLRHNWTPQIRSNGVYFSSKIGKKMVYLHRFLCPNYVTVDHRDTNTLNNKRENLRNATMSQQRFNSRKAFDTTSIYKGVSRKQGRSMWDAKIYHNKRYIFLGAFNTPEEAARAYDKAALEYRAEYARLNFKEKLDK